MKKIIYAIAALAAIVSCQSLKEEWQPVFTFGDNVPQPHTVYTTATLPGFGGGDITIAPRGLDLSADYRVTLDNTGDSFTFSGASLAQNGLTVRGLSPMRSELALFERL